MEWLVHPANKVQSRQQTENRAMGVIKSGATTNVKQRATMMLALFLFLACRGQSNHTWYTFTKQSAVSQLAVSFHPSHY